MASDPRLPPGVALVVLGATGDLAHRKLYPALAELADRDQLPEHVALIGVARTQMGHDDFAATVRKSVVDAHPDALAALDDHDVSFHYVSGSFDSADTFRALRERLEACDRDHGTAGNRIFYLSTIPRLFETAVAGLGASGLADEPRGTFTRVVVEKPFGHDLESARALNEFVHGTFAERQIFRIDHYLGKETVQNILALRFANTIFEPIWNRRYVEHVQITVAEPIGVGHRGSFYEQAGVVRDIVQNHGMQVLSLTTMEPPASLAADAVRDEKVKLLRSIRRPSARDLGTRVVRGQYTMGVVDGEQVPGYRDEEGVADDSDTSTYVAVRLEVDNWRWAGVPIYLRAGKRLAARATEVVLQFREVPHLPLPADAVQSLEPNTMVLRIQPDEGIHLGFAAKVPGASFRVRRVPLGFTYREGFHEAPPEAYERLLADVILGDATLFIREDEVEASWEVVEPFLEGIAGGTVPLRRYEAGTWGPVAADAILLPGCDAWREPLL